MLSGGQSALISVSLPPVCHAAQPQGHAPHCAAFSKYAGRDLPEL